MEVANPARAADRIVGAIALHPFAETKGRRPGGRHWEYQAYSRAPANFVTQSVIGQFRESGHGNGDRFIF